MIRCIYGVAWEVCIICGGQELCHMTGHVTHHHMALNNTNCKTHSQLSVWPPRYWLPLYKKESFKLIATITTGLTSLCCESNSSLASTKPCWRELFEETVIVIDLLLWSALWYHFTATFFQFCNGFLEFKCSSNRDNRCPVAEQHNDT